MRLNQNNVNLTVKVLPTNAAMPLGQLSSLLIMAAMHRTSMH